MKWTATLTAMSPWGKYGLPSLTISPQGLPKKSAKVHASVVCLVPESAVSFLSVPPALIRTWSSGPAEPTLSPGMPVRT
jgi:hypothetical protein